MTTGSDAPRRKAANRSRAALWRDLDRRIAGAVVTSGDPNYETARAVPSARFRTSRPDAIVVCAEPADVSVVLAATARAGPSMSVRSGGHCFAGRSSAGEMILDVRRLQQIEVAGDTVRVGAGVRLGELYDRLATIGRTVAGGNGSTVGVSGLVLGGGLGILGRRHGLACDGLRAAEIVLGDGSTLISDDQRDPDLFWALRGAGGGRFGVVTALVLETVAAPAMTAFTLRWEFQAATRVVEAWQAFAPDAARGLAASLLLTAPGDPRAEPTAVVAGTMVGDGPATEEALSPLLNAIGVAPSRRDVSHADYRAIKRMLEPADINTDHRTYLHSQFHVRPLPPEAVTALVSRLSSARRAGLIRELDFTPWGGAYGDVASEATAFPHRHDRFLLKHSVAVPAKAPRAEDRDAQVWLANSYEIAAASGTGRAYPNFPDPELTNPSEAYFAQNLPRLRQVQARYDPEGRFDHL